jgi:PQQ-dependent catabolism-associated CXXCW motif protein
MERQDFGVPPTPQLHQGPMHGPTPASIPGARLVTTAELARMLSAPNPPVLVDVLGGPPHPSLPGAIQVASGGMGGSFNDQSQAQLAGALRQATGGDSSRPVVLFCLSPQCWLSYNATLRARQAGFQQALWYRGGLESWAAAGLPMAPPGGGTAMR